MSRVNLDAYRAFLFDVDGVLRRGSAVIQGAPDAVRRLRAMGKRVACVTNNSAHTAAELHGALREHGFPFEVSEVISAPNATARWLASEGKGRTAFVLGSEGLQQELRSSGMRVVDHPERIDYRCDYLVLAGCRHITYELLTKALRVALTGATCVAVNRDRVFPGRDGIYPGAGAIVGAVEGMLGREIDVLIGKPSPLLGRMALDELGVAAQECLMIGDTPETDIQMGQAVGMDTALVLTGTTESADPGEFAPTYVLSSVVDLVGRL